MIEVAIPKDNWEKYTDWCIETFLYEDDYPIFKDGKPMRILFPNQRQRMWFALRFGV